MAVAAVGWEHPPCAVRLRLIREMLNRSGTERPNLRPGFRIAKSDAARFSVEPFVR